MEQTPFIDKQEEIIEHIRAVIADRVCCEDATAYFVDVKTEMMEESPAHLLEEIYNNQLEEDMPEEVEALKKMKRPPEPLGITGIFTCLAVTAETIPEDMDVQVDEATYVGLTYTFEVNRQTITWLAKMLDTEEVYLKKYDYITTCGR